MTSQRYGDLIRLDTTAGSAATPEILPRVSRGAVVSEGSISEAKLQDLLFRYPEALPIADIDAAYARAIPICMELYLPSSGYADALYINHLGGITLTEFKLWRNPQARREVIAQILDYARVLASWDYEDLQRQVSLSLGGRAGNAPYDLVKAQYPQVDEAEFVDNVTRHLKRGEFLLLIVGDGIQESAENITKFVQQHSLHFTLALVEAALYRDAANSLIVQPRVLARTEIVQRFVVEGGIVKDAAMANEVDHQEPLSDQEAEHLRFWTAVLNDFSFSDPDVPVPAPTKQLTQYVKVEGSGHGGYALSFSPYLNRSAGEMGCYLIAFRNREREGRIFNELADAKDTLLPGIEQWPSSDGLKIGFRRRGSLGFLAGDEDSEAYRAAVSWMREHLNLLVSTLHPVIQAKLSNPA